jgi:hypothetical protein
MIPTKVYNGFQNNLRNNQGAVIILFALILFVLLGFVALGLDITKVVVARDEKKYSADYLALAALKQYNEVEPTLAQLNSCNTNNNPAQCRLLTRHQAKYLSARSRVSFIGGLNKAVFGELDGTSRTQVKSDGSDLADISDMSNSASAVISPGRWWTQKPTNCTGSDPQIASCPCGRTTFPCFQTCNVESGCINPDDSNTSPLAAAIKVSLKNKGEEGVKTVFGTFVGRSSMQVSSHSLGGSNGAIAAMFPKYSLILVDLGREVVIDDDFLPQEFRPGMPKDNARKEYAYKLTGAPTGGCNAAANTCGAACSIDTLSGAAPGYADTYNDLIAAQQSFYYCFSPKNNGSTEYHLVNQNPNLFPQPFSSFMSAANQILLGVQSSGNAVDKIALIGIDDTYIPEREIAFTTRGTADFNRMVSITGDRKIAAENFFFPRAGAVSSLPTALRTAITKLKDQIERDGRSFSNVDASIYLFTNGLTSCTDTPKLCRGYAGSQANSNQKKDYFQLHSDSWKEVFDEIVKNELKPKNIKINVFTSGKKTFTHQMLVKSAATNGCSSDLELRQNQLASFYSDTNANDYAARFLDLGMKSSAETLPYDYSTHSLFSLAAMTNGSYMPLLPKCSPNFKAASGTNYNDANALCQAKGVTTSPSGSNIFQRVHSVAVRDLSIPTTVLDANGRLFCSGEDLTIAEQLAGVVKDLIEKRSVLLVSTK